MNPFFAYLMKSSLSLMLLYCLFRVSMRNDRNHTLNRFLLLGILGVSAIIPSLNIQFFYEDIPLKSVETIREFVSAPVFSEPVLTETIQPVLEASSLSINWGLLFYISVSSVLFLRLIFGVIQVMKIIKRAEKRRLQKIVLALVKDLIQPFSFLNKVVLSEKDYNENKQIIVAHEYAHIKQLHAIDLMVCELFTVLQFFNPFMWLLRRDIKLIHEYQADEAVLNKGIDAQKYQLLVLKKAVGERRFAMANQFTQKPILKRLTMMTKTNKSRWGRVKLLLFVPIIIVLLQAFARPEILVEKAIGIIPVVQQDSSEIWLNNWSIDNIGRINGGMILNEVEIKPPPPSHPKSDLPKYDKSRDGNPIPSANIFPILINRKNEVLAANTRVSEKELSVGVEQFLRGKNPFSSAKPSPEFVNKNLPLVGSVKVTKGVMVIRYDRDSDKKFINNLLRNIGQSYLTVRDETANNKFGQDYYSLDSEKKGVVNQMVPTRISIMPPKTIKPPPPPPPPPPPVQINLKNNGDIFIGKTRYDSFSEFQDKLTAWDNGVRNSNKKNGSHYLNKARISIESAVAEDKVKLVKEALIRANFKTSNLLFIKDDVPGKLKAPPPPPPILRVHLYRDKVIIHKDELLLTEVASVAEDWLKRYGKNYMVNIHVHGDVADERINELKSEMIKGGVKNQISIRRIK